jgi:adenylate cyclase class IV
MSQFEIEVKTLLGEKKNADALKARMCEYDPSCACVSVNKQLNHYFEGGDLVELYRLTHDLFLEDARSKFAYIAEKGTNFSVRTRQKDDTVLLVIKASIDGGTSANTVSRMEFEEEVNATLSELDERVLQSGFTYQAKWSRDREEYNYKGINVCIDRNAGYGYLAEFEKVVQGEHDLDAIRNDIDHIMAELEVVELPQDRLERMFAHYNKNWPEYYGTEKVFIIE